MTERLIPFDLEAAKANPSRVRSANGGIPYEVLFGEATTHVRFHVGWEIYSYRDSSLSLRLTAPKSIVAKGQGFVRWLTNWHIEGGKVFVEVE